MVNIKTYFKSFAAIVILLIIAVCSHLLLGNEKYMLVSLIAAFITCIPFFARFDNKKNTTREIVVIAAMVALCIAGRLVFTPLPHFKPITALVIITGINFGADAGFITGSVTALLSNMHFGQGPWTVFQMATWGMIGFLSGVLKSLGILNNKYTVSAFSGLCGVVFSLVMDIYTVLSIDSAFSFSRYLFYVANSLPVMLEYVISNIVFMILLEKPIGKKLKRVKTKYGLFNG